MVVTRILAALALTTALVGCSASPDKPPYVIAPSAAPDAGIAAPLTNEQIVAARTDPGPPVLVIHPNANHVTGTPYPTSCIRWPGDDPKLPVRTCTPGSVRDDITVATLCAQGWSTDTIRPPRTETDALKTFVMRAYAIPTAQRATTELDHLVPLELGGSDDVTNFWAEPSDLPGHTFRNLKDGVEGRLRLAVCAHRVTLAAAQWAIAVNWQTAEKTLGLHTR